MPSPRRVFIGLRVDPAALAEVDAIAAAEGTSRSAVVRRFVEEGLQRRREEAGTGR